jgi:hypothetical protein
MRFAPLAMLAAAGAAFAEDLLFIDSLEYTEYAEATTKLGYSGMLSTVHKMVLMLTLPQSRLSPRLSGER